MTAFRLRGVPLQFGPSDRALFGWYHPAVGAPRATGIVICNPIGDDYIRAHRTLRHLAERLAADGFSVMRFDFHGTGDSSGDERSPDLVKSWLDDIGLAAAELRAQSGAERIGLAGLRLGATMAMEAAERGGIDSLVLWSPYLAGADFVNEKTKMHKMHKALEPESFTGVPGEWSSGGQEALGFLLTDGTVADLKKIDLRAIRKKPANATLVIGTGNVASSEDAFLAHLTSIGAAPEFRHLPGHKFLIMAPHRSTVPQEIVDAIADWLGKRYPVTTAPAPTVPHRALDLDEHPLVFGATHPLFGMLSRPPKALRHEARPAIIMVNAGSTHRIGPNRLYVTLSRRWSALGFDVLRFDLSGIGDSPAAPGSEENLAYAPAAVDDTRAAMTALAEATGARRFVLVGIDSGADIAFQCTRDDSRVAGVLMINPHTFGMYDRETVETYKRARYYQQSLFRLASWQKALRGQVDFRRAIGMVLPKAADLVRRKLEQFLPARGAERKRQTDVPGCLRDMAERGVDTFLVAGEHDPGVDFVDVHFGRQMQRLGELRGFRRVALQGSDRTFTSIYSQQLVADLVTEHFQQHHLS